MSKSKHPIIQWLFKHKLLVGTGFTVALLYVMVIFSVMFAYVFVGVTGRSGLGDYPIENIIDPSQAKLLDVPYFNQWLEPDGTGYPTDPKLIINGDQWDYGWVICGAASSVMVAGFYNKLEYSSEYDLKKYAYSDSGEGLSNKCSDKSKGGAFGITASDSNCNQSSFGGVSNYLGVYNLKTKYIPVNFESIKQAIDNGHPLIMSISAPYGHINVIKGYTYEGNGIVMNDSFKNVLESGSYSFNGKNAVYHLDDSRLVVNGILEVYE